MSLDSVGEALELLFDIGGALLGREPSLVVKPPVVGRSYRATADVYLPGFANGVKRRAGFHGTLLVGDIVRVESMGSFMKRRAILVVEGRKGAEERLVPLALRTAPGYTGYRLTATARVLEKWFVAGDGSKARVS